jgi:hypothetical protein
MYMTAALTMICPNMQVRRLTESPPPTEAEARAWPSSKSRRQRFGDSTG